MGPHEATSSARIDRRHFDVRSRASNNLWDAHAFRWNTKEGSKIVNKVVGIKDPSTVTSMPREHDLVDSCILALLGHAATDHHIYLVLPRSVGIRGARVRNDGLAHGETVRICGRHSVLKGTTADL